MRTESQFSFSPLDHSREFLNRINFAARNSLAFSRAGFQLKPSSEASYEQWEQKLAHHEQALLTEIEQRYNFKKYRSKLSLDFYKLNLATLFAVDHYLHTLTKNKSYEQIYEIGCQNFSRAPALWEFFNQGAHPFRLTGIELDAFPPLNSLHSRFDIARYFCKMLDRSRFVAADICQWQDPFDLAFFFYPFVSPHPALAWGLPKKYGSAFNWLKSVVQNLRKGGLLILVHLGEWEEVEFDQARESFIHLKLIKRDKFRWPFIEHPYPAHIGIYEKR